MVKSGNREASMSLLIWRNWGKGGQAEPPHVAKSEDRGAFMSLLIWRSRGTGGLP